jgi:hypothetical protein
VIDYDEIEKNDKTPQKIMEYKFNVVYNRDWKRYLDSIEWDTWCKHETEEEREERLEQERLRSHPFSQWF